MAAESAEHSKMLVAHDPEMRRQTTFITLTKRIEAISIDLQQHRHGHHQWKFGGRECCCKQNFGRSLFLFRNDAATELPKIVKFDSLEPRPASSLSSRSMGQFASLVPLWVSQLPHAPQH